MSKMKSVSCLEGGGPGKGYQSAWRRRGQGNRRTRVWIMGRSCQGWWYHILQRDELDQCQKSLHHPQNLKLMHEDCWQWSPLSFRNLTPDPSLLLLNYNSPLLCASPNMTLVPLFLYWTGSFRCNLLPFRLTWHYPFPLLETVQLFLYIFISSHFVLMVAYKLYFICSIAKHISNNCKIFITWLVDHTEDIIAFQRWLKFLEPIPLWIRTEPVKSILLECAISCKV